MSPPVVEDWCRQHVGGCCRKAYADAKGLAKDGDYTKLLPKYPNQTIWPYTDMVQHRLFMENDIRTGWCRTTHSGDVA